MTTAAIVAFISSAGDPDIERSDLAFALWQRLDQRVWERILDIRACDNIWRRRDLYKRYKWLQEMRDKAWEESLK